VANERAIASSCEKSCVNERPEHSVASGFVEPPKPLRLLRRQSQPRHFEKFSLNSSDDLLDPSAVCHRSPRLRCQLKEIHTQCQPKIEGKGPELLT
jgi:hypothetical protein